MSAQNLTLLTDLYELTMMQGYFESQANETVIFDVFFRENPNKGGYSVMAGLEQVIEYIKNLNFSYEDVDYLRGLGLFSEDFLHYLSGFHFSGDIYAIPERQRHLSAGTARESDRPYHGSAVSRNRDLKHYQPSVFDRNKGFPRCPRGTGKRRDGIRSAPRPGA